MAIVSQVAGLGEGLPVGNLLRAFLVAPAAWSERALMVVRRAPALS